MKKQTKDKIINKLENPNIITYLIISITVIGFYFLCLLPVLFDFHNSVLFWKIAMIIGSSIFAIIFLIIVIIGSILIKKAKKETNQEQLEENKEYIRYFIVFIIVTLAIFIYSCLHYFNNTLWGADLTINVLFFMAICLIAIFLIVEQFFGNAFNNEIKPMVLLSVAFLSLLFAFIFELSNTDIQYSSVLYKISIGIFYLVFIALLVNRIIYNKEEFEKINKNKKIGKIISFVFWASLLLITFPFYINWWGLQGEDYKTFLTVYSAIVGGGLTLLGVAWTIKKGDENRKEEERKKAMPYFSLGCRIVKDCAEFYENNDEFTSKTKIGYIMLYAAEKAESIILGAVINNIFYKLKDHFFAKKSEYYCIEPLNLKELVEVKSCYLIVQDLLGNYYQFDLKIKETIESDKNNYLDYEIINIGLPKLLSLETINEIKGFTNE